MLHDDAPKRVTTQRPTATEPEKTDLDFHPEPLHGEGTHNDAHKRDATPTGIAIAGTGARIFRLEPHMCHTWYTGR